MESVYCSYAHPWPILLCVTEPPPLRTSCYRDSCYSWTGMVLSGDIAQGRASAFSRIQNPESRFQNPGSWERCRSLRAPVYIVGHTQSRRSLRPAGR